MHRLTVDAASIKIKTIFSVLRKIVRKYGSWKKIKATHIKIIHPEDGYRQELKLVRDLQYLGADHCFAGTKSGRPSYLVPFIDMFIKSTSIASIGKFITTSWYNVQISQSFEQFGKFL